MQAVWIARYGKPDVLEVRENEDPVASPGEVRIRVRALGINFAENMATPGRRRMTRIAAEFVNLPWWTPMKLMNENKGVAGVNMGHLRDERAMTEAAFTALLGLYEQGKNQPRVDRAFPLEGAADAHAYIETGQNVGKILLTP